MHNWLLAYLSAIAVGGLSQFVKGVFPDQHWLGAVLLYLAFAIALLATLGLARGLGWFNRVAALLRRRRQARTGTMVSADLAPTKVAPRGANACSTTSAIRVPRPS